MWSALEGKTGVRRKRGTGDRRTGAGGRSEQALWRRGSWVQTPSLLDSLYAERGKEEELPHWTVMGFERLDPCKVPAAARAMELRQP